MANSKVVNMLCRTCAADCSPMDESVHIFMPDRNFNDTMQQIRFELRCKWNLEVEPGDGLPEQICLPCVQNFMDYFQFRRSCMQIHEQHLLNLSSPDQASLPDEVKSLAKYPHRIVEADDLSAVLEGDEVDLTGQCTHTTSSDSSRATDSPDDTFAECVFEGVFQEILQDSAMDLEETSTDLECEKKTRNAKKLALRTKKAKTALPTTATGRDSGHYCPYCYLDKTDPNAKRTVYASETELQEHVDETHNKMRPYNCHLCERTYPTSTARSAHIRIKHKKLIVLCEECGKPCNLNNIRKHKEIFHIRGNYKCEVCGRKYQNVSLNTFEHHKKWHKPHLLRKCEICQHAFLHQRHYDEHMRVHSPVGRPYKCTQCSFYFKTASSMRKHAAAQHKSGEKISCLHCEDEFRSKTDLNDHMRLLHRRTATLHCRIKLLGPGDLGCQASKDEHTDEDEANNGTECDKGKDSELEQALNSIITEVI